MERDASDSKVLITGTLRVVSFIFALFYGFTTVVLLFGKDLEWNAFIMILFLAIIPLFFAVLGFCCLIKSPLMKLSGSLEPKKGNNLMLPIVDMLKDFFIKTASNSENNANILKETLPLIAKDIASGTDKNFEILKEPLLLIAKDIASSSEKNLDTLRAILRETSELFPQTSLVKKNNN